MYFSLVYPYLIYYITVWGSTYQTNLKRIITLQKIVIKIISNVPFDAHTDNLFRDHQILNLMIFIYFKLLTLCFCIQKACFPIPLIICLLLQTKYTLITQEILIAFIFSLVEQKVNIHRFCICFTIHLITKFRIVSVLVCLVNCLKNFFLQN